MLRTDKLIIGLEEAYKKMVEYKKYKKTPIIVSENGRIIKIDPQTVDLSQNVYKRV